MQNFLDANRIAELSRAAAAGVMIEVVAETASTNTDLRQRVGQLKVPVLRAAEYQSAGRGRAGRTWHAAVGDSLCFSLAWPFSRSVAQLTGLPLAVGVALADTLRALGFPVSLKWPNDLLLNAAKLGGVLVETATVRSGTTHQVWAVTGVGINVRPNPVRDADVSHEVASLGEQIDRNELLAKLIDSLVDVFALFDASGLAPFIERWQRWHAYAGLPVRVTEQNQLLFEGIARGIDSEGCLQLETSSGMVAVAAGDISLRLLSKGDV